MNSATRIYNAPRGTGFSRGGGKPHTPHQQPQHQQSDRPLPPSYVCYRCGQKGPPYPTIDLYFSPTLCPAQGHWIQDCPTNNDREFDNRPRIKRTTGIPRSMLKAVENPNTATELGQGVMVTPEGGYVVAQPDLYAVPIPAKNSSSPIVYSQSIMAKAGRAAKRSLSCRGPRTNAHRSDARVSD